MKLVQINTFPYKATGSIMCGIHERASRLGIDSYIIWGRGRKPSNDHEFSIEDKIGIKFHGLMTRITDRTGFYSKKATKKMLTILDQIHPDIIHLHNLHGYYLNLSMLFAYLKSHQIKVVWTLHDCWSFTGHCAYYSMVGCEKWKSGCHDCPQKQTYPSSLMIDNSKRNWEQKKEMFTSVQLTIVTVSKWLEYQVKQSFLKNQTTEVITNGVDLHTFKPAVTDVRQRYGLSDKKIVLAVASEWTERKGLRDVLELASKMPDVQVVIIGAGEMKERPENVMPLPRCKNLKELVSWYSAADVLFNPSKEETFGMTLVESMACGTPPVAYNKTAFPEVLSKHQELIVKDNTVETAIQIIRELFKNEKESVYWVEMAQKYDASIQYQAYLELYRRLME